MTHTLLLDASQVKWGMDFPGENPGKQCGIEPAPSEVAGMGSERTVVVLRVSNDRLNTENQWHAMKDFIATLPKKPSVLRVQQSNYRKPIPEMERLLEDVEAGKYKAVYFWRVCRSGRDHIYDCQLWNAAVKSGTDLQFVSNGLSSLRQSDRLTFQILSSVAEHERLTLVLRTKEGQARYREDCRKAGVKCNIGGSKSGRWWDNVRDAIPAALGLLRDGWGSVPIAKALKIGPKSVLRIRRTPIEELRRVTGIADLQPWQE